MDLLLVVSYRRRERHWLAADPDRHKHISDTRGFTRSTLRPEGEQVKYGTRPKDGRTPYQGWLSGRLELTLVELTVELTCLVRVWFVSGSR
jgi:hypothetical protein